MKIKTKAVLLSSLISAALFVSTQASAHDHDNHNQGNKHYKHDKEWKRYNKHYGYYAHSPARVVRETVIYRDVPTIVYRQPNVVYEAPVIYAPRRPGITLSVDIPPIIIPIH